MFSICKHQNTGTCIFFFYLQTPKYRHLSYSFLFVNTKVGTCAWAYVIKRALLFLIRAHVFWQIWCRDIPCVYFSSLWPLVVLVHFRHNASSPSVLSLSIFGYINLQSQRSYFYFWTFRKIHIFVLSVIPFLLLGIGIDNIFVITQTFNTMGEYWVVVLMTDVEVNCNNLILILMIIDLCQKFNSIQQNYTKINLNI